MKEIVNNKQIEEYIDKLIKSYGIYPIVSETALKIQYDHGLYAECVLEMMRKMGLQNTVKVVCYAEHRYPGSPNSGARILIPSMFPTFGTPAFNALRILVQIRESQKEHFHAFVANIAHELSHLVMYATKHELKKSEIATDLCALVFGFSDFAQLGRTFQTESIVGTTTHTNGYLSKDQLAYAIWYLDKIREETKQPSPKENEEKEDLRSRLKKLIRKYL